MNKTKDMLKVLHQVELLLPQLIREEAEWKSLYVDYHPPFVERLYHDWNRYRIHLHKIHPCDPSEALFHVHARASAVKILSGKYEMTTGYIHKITGEPIIVSRSILSVGSSYEMTNPQSAHSVSPIEIPSYSLMVTDSEPWIGHVAPKSTKTLEPLSVDKRNQLFVDFIKIYKADIEPYKKV